MDVSAWIVPPNGSSATGRVRLEFRWPQVQLFKEVLAREADPWRQVDRRLSFGPHQIDSSRKRSNASSFPSISSHMSAEYRTSQAKTTSTLGHFDH